LYGASKALAALGDPHWRGHYAHYPTMYQALKTDKAYLGYANLLRMKKLYAVAGNDAQALKEEAGEMLLGDPFLDLQPTATGTNACTAPAWDRMKAYVGGDKVSFAGHQYVAAYWSEDSEPDRNSGGPRLGSCRRRVTANALGSRRGMPGSPGISIKWGRCMSGRMGISIRARM
jgi:hypothetical protein